MAMGWTGGGCTSDTYSKCHCMSPSELAEIVSYCESRGRMVKEGSRLVVLIGKADAWLSQDLGPWPRLSRGAWIQCWLMLFAA